MHEERGHSALLTRALLPCFGYAVWHWRRPRCAQGMNAYTALHYSIHEKLDGRTKYLMLLCLAIIE